MTITPKPEPRDPALPPSPPKSRPQPKEDPKKVLGELSKYRRGTAWPVTRWPVEKRVVYQRTRVHLPRTYLARHGSDVRAVYPGQDINQLVHKHYFEEVGKDGRRLDETTDGTIMAIDGVGHAGTDVGKLKQKGTEKDKAAWPNYVAAEGLCARRHEYLGPDPRVAGYHVDAAGEYHVKWYDTFLGDQWMDAGKWDFDVRLDDDGHWVDADD